MVACLIIENETADCYHGTNVMRNGSKGMYNIDTGFIHSGKVRRKLSFFFLAQLGKVREFIMSGKIKT